MPTKKQKELLARKQAMIRLGFSDEEIADVLKCDEEIEHGAKLFSLDDEHEKASRDVRSTTAMNKVYTFEKKERKANFDKRGIIDHLRQSLSEISESVEVVNIEREISFVSNGVKYRLTLAVPRK